MVLNYPAVNENCNYLLPAVAEIHLFRKYQGTCIHKVTTYTQIQLLSFKIRPLSNKLGFGAIIVKLMQFITFKRNNIFATQPTLSCLVIIIFIINKIVTQNIGSFNKHDSYKLSASQLYI